MGLFEVFSGALAAFYAVVPSFGLSIILLTVAVRVVLLPLSIKQTRSMREMQRIQPEVKKLQAKYKGNRQKLNEEMMKLYKEHNVNPFGGCLPLVMQFPVLIGLFYVIRSPLKYMGYLLPGTGVAADATPVENVSGLLQTIQQSRLAEELQEHTLRVNEFLGFLRLDCTSSAAISGQDPSGVGATCGDGFVSALPYLVLVVLMGVTTWYQQKQMTGSRGANDPQAQQMQMFMKIMPAMLMFFAFTFPSGVVMYWLTTNVWTIGQQRLMLKAAPAEPPKKGDASKPKADEGDTTKDGKAGGKSTGTKAPPGKPGGSGDGRPQSSSRQHPSSKKKKKRR
jgi:YidC/Oxa1 family membrane protein insertase